MNVADEPLAGKEWTPNEVRLIVADYFDMLEMELLLKPYNKSDHRKQLAKQLAERSRGSIEFKHQNISGVLVDLGMPYIEGYKPLGNYQGMLGAEVESFLEKHPDFFERLASAPLLNPSQPKPVPQVDLEQVIEGPPERILASAPGKPWLSRRGRKIDFPERDAANRRLGTLGEQFVYELEKYRLRSAGRDDLAQRVVWASRDIGDGLGFDILSLDEADESERMLEVKTTGLGKYFPFCVSSTEVRCSEDIPQQYHLFRVFDFGRSPRAYVLRGSLREVCRLDPVMYRAAL
jgi:hypothetical protein